MIAEFKESKKVMRLERRARRVTFLKIYWYFGPWSSVQALFVVFSQSFIVNAYPTRVKGQVYVLQAVMVNK